MFEGASHTPSIPVGICVLPGIPTPERTMMNETTCTGSCTKPAATARAESPNEPSRRHALFASATASAIALSGCGEGSSSGGSAAGSAGQGPSEPTNMGSVSNVPVGKAAKLAAGKVTAIISQPQEGTYKAFSSVCTHQGCQVNVQNGAKIVCPCHNSQFSLDDGSVQGGPAEKPLDAYKVEVKDGAIWVG